MKNFEYLLPYTKVERRSHFLYLVTKTLFRTQTLFSAISSNKLEMTEMGLFKIFNPIFFTLANMHAAGIIHGQITPTKFLITNDTCYLYDPCVGTESTTDRIKENFGFLSPEDLMNALPSFESDVWSIGAVLYYLITGTTVFNAKSYEEYIEAAKTSEVNFYSDVWNYVSPSFKNLIQRMLNKSKNDRIKMKEVLTHEWFHGKFSALNNIIVNSYILINNNYETCIRKTKYYMANNHSFLNIKEYQKKSKELDKGNVGCVDYGEMIRTILKDNYTKCQHCDTFIYYPIRYKHLLNDVTILNSLIMEERMSLLFEQLSGNKPYLEQESIKCLLAGIAHSDYTVQGVFEDLVRTYQNPQRTDITLTYEEFWSMCRSIEFAPSEEFIIGGFF
jgi:serine/threonine protein kinase